MIMYFHVGASLCSSIIHKHHHHIKAEAADDIRREITEVQSRVQSKKKELRKAEDLLRVIEQTIAAGNPADNLDTIRKMLV